MDAWIILDVKLFDIPVIWCFMIILICVMICDEIYYLWYICLRICVWKISVINLYRLSNILLYLICDDWMMLHYCVKPLDHTIHTQLWISRRNRLSPRFWKKVWIWIFKFKCFGNGIGIEVKSFWNGISKMEIYFK